MIPDDLLDGYLKGLLGESEPGDAMHRMFVVTADPAGYNALGLPEPGKLSLAVYALALDADSDADEFIGQAILAAMVEADNKGTVIHFAGLAKEIFGVPDSGDEASENLARRLQADGKLHQHPDVAEVTRLYAASRDGRRWTGQRVVTGPDAGSVSEPRPRVGRLADQEIGLHQRLIRAAVGIKI